jgi:hypothetical protein
MRAAAALNLSILASILACSHDAQPTAPPPVVPATGTLVVDIAGMTRGPAQVVVSAPSGYTRTVTASTTITGLDSGLYAIDAAVVTVDDTVYGPSSRHAQVWVSASVSPVEIAVTYFPRIDRPAPPAGAYVGAFASYGGGGTVVVELPSSGIVATGSLAISGGVTVPLSGRFALDSSPQLVLAGGGYVLNGLDSTGGRIAGSLNGPGGSGEFAIAAGGPGVEVFCGVITGQVAGTWNMVLDTTGRVSVLAFYGTSMVGRFLADSVPPTVIVAPWSPYYAVYRYAKGTLDLANGTGAGVFETGIKHGSRQTPAYRKTGTWSVSKWAC